MNPEWQPYRGVRASAGSGKTYQLTGHYLRALLTGAPPGSLMATTFTRKAAGEILERVITRLGGACESDEKLRSLAADLVLPDLDRIALQAHMKQLCESLDEVAISTIDALFARLLRGYAHELDVPEGVRVLDADAPEMLRLRQTAAADLLDGGDAGDSGDAAALLETLAGGEPGRSVIGGILLWVERGYELFAAARPEAWQLDLEMPAPLDQAQLGTAIDGLAAFADHPNANIRKAVQANLDAALAGDWAAFVDKGIAKPLLLGGPAATFYKKPVPEEIAASCAPLIAHARAALAAEHLRRHDSLRALLAGYDDAYRRRRSEAGALCFSDVAGLLAAALPAQDAAGLDYRLGRTPRHLLLDEFQDTDPRQYAVLKPFALAATLAEHGSGAGSLFCVGDHKQSIYGWRGATPALFERIARDLPCLAWSDSDVSYRSARPVLECVNALFGALSSNAVLSRKAPDVAEEWQRHFRPHTSSRPALAGYVELVQLAAEKNAIDLEPEPEGGVEIDDAAGAGLRAAADKIKAIRDAAPARSIAVLTRTNDAVRELLPLLVALGVPAASESGSAMGDSPTVGLIFSALSFADHSGDTAARFHLTNSPLAPLLSLAAPDALDPALAALAIRGEISTRGLADVIAEWSDVLIPRTDRRGAARLAQLVELADEYVEGHPGWRRPAEFVEWARAQTRETPAAVDGEADTGAAVRVMTVHKSKGLEFDVVVLPELGKRLIRPQEMVFARDPDTQEIAALTLRPSRVAQACCPPLAELARRAESEQTAEALCLLYVALTRARYALHLLVPPLEETPSGKPSAPPFSLASILRAGLAREDALTDMSLPDLLWSCGDAEWHCLNPGR